MVAERWVTILLNERGQFSFTSVDAGAERRKKIFMWLWNQYQSMKIQLKLNGIKLLTIGAIEPERNQQTEKEEWVKTDKFTTVSSLKLTPCVPTDTSHG